MPIHESYARLTPYELAFPSVDWAEERFQSIGAEAHETGFDLADPTTFLSLSTAADTLREICGEEEGRESLHQYAALLFHAYQFWAASGEVFLLSLQAVREVVESGLTLEAWSSKRRSGYLQLPRHLFWVSAAEGVAPESLDGFFWNATDDSFVVLAAMGIRGDRPGLSVVSLPPVSMKGVAAWIGAPIREGGEDFKGALPGGEVEGLYSVATAGELLKLAVFAIHYLEHFPERVEARAAATSQELEEGDPTPSALPYKWVG